MKSDTRINVRLNDDDLAKLRELHLALGVDSDSAAIRIIIRDAHKRCASLIKRVRKLRKGRA